MVLRSGGNSPYIMQIFWFLVMCNIVGMFHWLCCLQCWNGELAMMRRYHSSQCRNLEGTTLRVQMY